MDDFAQRLGCHIDSYGGRFAKAHREMLEMYQRTREISDAVSARIQAAGLANADARDLRDWTNAHSELTVMRVFVEEFLAEAYGVEP